MGIKYANSLGLSKGLLDSELISQSSAQFGKKKWQQLAFFHKVLAKKGKSSIFGQERFPLCECFSDYRNFVSMLVITVHGRGWDKVVFEGGWVEGFLIEEILLPPTHS